MHTFKSVSTGISRIILDTRDIKVTKVYDFNSKQSLNYEIYPFDYITELKNDALVINLPRGLTYGEIIKIAIVYSTSPSATAVNWVPESQTFGKNYKFMYTLCEAIHCRSIAPLQDSPAIKSTFNATLRIKEPYMALTSARQISQRNENGYNIFENVQSIPVPSYLLALTAGNIGYKSMGSRCGIYAEPSIIDFAAEELSEMNGFLDTVIFIKLNIKNR